MIVTSGYDYVAADHKSDSVPLDAEAKLRVFVPASAGADVVLRVQTQRGVMTLTFPPGFNDWEPVLVQRINNTGTSGDTQVGVIINLGVA